MFNFNFSSVLSSLDVTLLKKRRLWFFIIGVLFFLVAFILFFKRTPVYSKKNLDSSLIEIKENKDDIHRSVVESENDLNNLNKQYQFISTHLKQQDKKISKQAVLINRYTKASNHLVSVVDSLQRKVKKLYSKEDVVGKMHSSKNRVNTEKVSALKKHNISVLAVSSPNKSLNIAKNTLNAPKNYLQHAWLPVGSFFYATLLNGVSAGTGSRAQSNPQPVLMHVDEDAFLPNQARYHIQSCFVLGSAYGSLPSQRVFIRTARISCVDQHNGLKMLDSELKGYVVDIDGKMGLRGRLINRRGSKLAKAMLAGFFGGISNVLSNAHLRVDASIHDMDTGISPSDSFQLAGLSGADSAMKDLANFYIDEAKRLFPVIEVNAGRKVVINVSHGVLLKFKSNIAGSI